MVHAAILEETRCPANRGLRSVAMPCGLGLGSGTVCITARTGATVFWLNHADADTLLRRADLAT